MSKTSLRSFAPMRPYLAIAATLAATFSAPVAATASATASASVTTPRAPAAAAPPSGTTVYRCGQTYQQAPCKDGQAVAVDDARDPAQRRAAQQAAAAERRAADGLAAERAKREKGLQPANAATAARRTTHVVVTPSSSEPKHPRSQKGKHDRPLEVTDKTLYATGHHRPSTSEAAPAAASPRGHATRERVQGAVSCARRAADINPAYLSCN